jgi:predicted nucleotidyltransferase
MTNTEKASRDSLRRFVPGIVDEIVEHSQPVRVVLFGSVARGEETEDSDLDFLVILKELDPTQRAHLMGNIRFAITAPASIDIFVTDVEEFERRKNVIGSMQYWPAHEGEIVYERAVA